MDLPLTEDEAITVLAALASHAEKVETAVAWTVRSADLKGRPWSPRAWREHELANVAAVRDRLTRARRREA